MVRTVRPVGLECGSRCVLLGLERTTAPPDPLSHGASQRTADTRLRLQADPGLPEG